MRSSGPKAVQSCGVSGQERDRAYLKRRSGIEQMWPLWHQLTSRDATRRQCRGVADDLDLLRVGWRLPDREQCDRLHLRQRQRQARFNPRASRSMSAAKKTAAAGDQLTRICEEIEQIMGEHKNI